MLPVVVVLVAATVAGAIVGYIAFRFPAIDPAAPHVSPTTVRKEVRAHHGLSPFLRARLNPEQSTGLLLTAALAIAVLGALAVGALLVMVQHHALLARYDSSAARWGADHATSTSTQVLRQISVLGGTFAMIVIAVVIAVAEWIRSRRAAALAFMATVIIGQVVIMNVTKYLVDRGRPDIRQLTGFSGSSFPSGHATTAAATFAAVAFLLGRARSRRTKAVYAGVAAAIAVGVATTRVLLGVHWLTDVLAGLALGWGWFAISSIAFGGRVLRFGQPVAIAEATAETIAAPRAATRDHVAH